MKTLSTLVKSPSEKPDYNKKNYRVSLYAFMGVIVGLCFSAYGVMKSNLKRPAEVICSGAKRLYLSRTKDSCMTKQFLSFTNMVYIPMKLTRVFRGKVTTPLSGKRSKACLL